MKQKFSHLILIIFLLGVAAAVRFYKINTPLADWHSWRQADTASVTREFVKHDYSLFAPRYHDLSSIPNGLNNPEGYRMVEFPLVNYGIAQIIRTHPQLDLIVTSRVVSVAFSLVTIVSLYGLVFQLTRRRRLAFLTGVIYALLPYIVFYSRVILPEPIMVASQVFSLWMFNWWLQNQETAGTRHPKSVLLYLLSLVGLAFSLLLKPTAVFIAPAYLVLSLNYFGWKAVFSPWLWGYVLLGAAPVVWWRNWIKQFPAGIPASSWLLNGNDIRLRPAWWRWLFADRIARLMLGYWGVFFVGLGLLNRVKTHLKRTSLFEQLTLSWAAGMLLYLIVFATGNVQHDYYQAMLAPIMAILFARGLDWLISQLLSHHSSISRRLVALPTIGVILGLTFFLAWWEVRGYYNINNPDMVAAGQRVDQLTPATAKVIAPYGGDTAFLFQTNRTGWPVGGDIDQMISYGATHYVTTAKDQEAQALMENFAVLEETDQYVIIDLQDQPAPEREVMN